MRQAKLKPNGANKTLSILQHLSDRAVGGRVFKFNPRCKDDLQSQIQENRLSSMAHRHQYEMESSSIPYAMMAFPEKGVLIVSNDSGLDIMYIEEFKTTTSRTLAKPATWIINESSSSKFFAFENSKMEDICGKMIEAGTNLYFLAVTNSWMCGVAGVKLISGPRTASVRSNLSISLATLRWRKRAIWCCDYNPLNKQLAIGGEKFVSVDELERRLRRMATIPGNVRALTYNSSGSIIYCGAHNGCVYYIDLRAGLRPVGSFRISPGIQKMGLFSGDRKMLVSCFDHSLAQVDLRVNRTPLFYPEHYNNDAKIPFSFCEVNDVLCSAGQDSKIRFWSLTNGRFLYYLEPNNGHTPHAWYSENWNTYSSQSKISTHEGVVVVTGPSVYLLDL